MDVIIKLNGIDIQEQWAAHIEGESLNRLTLPPPAKKPIENNGRIADGKQVLYSPLKVDERELQLVFAFARNGVSFRQRCAEMATEMLKGEIVLEVDGTKYHLYYTGARTLNTLRDTMGTLAIQLNEPNPRNRV